MGALDPGKFCAIFVWKDIHYCKSLKFSDTQNVCCNHFKIHTKQSFLRKKCPKDADGMANSVDPDQTAPLGAV